MMVKILVVMYICLLSLSLNARENPFFPSEGEVDLPYTSNEKRDVSPLKNASITLPSTARLIKKVSIVYENVDASIRTKEIELNNSVDWHLPVFISQTYIPSASNSDAPPVGTTTMRKSHRQVGKIKHASFFVSDKSFRVITADKLVRNFLLANPHRIVMDFKKDSSLRSYTKEVEKSCFTKIRFGNHKGYYRIVLELDGYYRYKVAQFDKGYEITLF